MNGTEPNASELRDRFLRTAERLTALGRESLLPGWIARAPERLIERPIILAGFGDLGNEYLRKLHEIGANVVGLIEERSGNKPGISPIVGLEELAQRHPEAMVLNGIANDFEQHRRITQICHQLRRDMATAYQYMAALEWFDLGAEFAAVIDPAYFTTSVLDNIDGFEQSAKFFPGEKSARIYWLTSLARLEMNNSPYAEAQRLSGPQYFHPRFDYSGAQTLVDAGAYDGADTERFLAEFNSGADCVMYELEPANAIVCDQKALELSVRFAPAQVHARPVGVWSRNDVLYLCGNGATARVSNPDEAEWQAGVVALDDELDKATLVKLEVEGAELQALEGARSLMRSARPNLSVSVYHLAPDIHTIPRFIEELDLGYEFELGHHSPWWSFTVLYAVAPERANKTGSSK